ncbi:hypothetical protein DSM112329_02797 [Paraconexibacter sp. AEG42_29]|uniref:Uncharacterized protein n=1 Tax=Paraconexibacter sp. AEG42_29 TaxID=2997339 RepID=A0AAU7AWB6_9ACTN
MLEIVAADEDAARATLRDRYGAGVDVRHCAPSRMMPKARAFRSWAAEGRRLKLFYEIDFNGEEPHGVKVVESEQEVRVTVTILAPAVGAVTRIGGTQPRTATADLALSVGQRKVIDASCGRQRPESDPQDGRGRRARWWRLARPRG